MKMLLYCTKSKPYLIHESGCYDSDDMCCDYNCFSVVDRQELYNQDISLDETYNGKIVGECDFEVEKIFYGKTNENRFLYPEPYIPYDYHTNVLTETQLCYKSKLDINTLNEYLKDKNGYAIHIKNLNIFYTPKELNEYYTKKKNNVEENEDLFMDGILYTPIKSAPQNMMYAKQPLKEDKIIISVKPEWLYKILNGEKTIEVRKKVLKEDVIIWQQHQA